MKHYGWMLATVFAITILLNVWLGSSACKASSYYFGIFGDAAYNYSKDLGNTFGGGGGIIFRPSKNVSIELELDFYKFNKTFDDVILAYQYYYYNYSNWYERLWWAAPELEVKQLPIMVTGKFYLLPSKTTSNSIRPHVDAGVGVSFIDTKIDNELWYGEIGTWGGYPLYSKYTYGNITEDDKTTSLIGNIGCGLEIPLGDRVYIDLAIKYIWVNSELIIYDSDGSEDKYRLDTFQAKGMLGILF